MWEKKKEHFLDLFFFFKWIQLNMVWLQTQAIKICCLVQHWEDQSTKREDMKVSLT